MLALGGLFLIVLAIGVAALAVKALICLVFLPLKLGFGLIKLLLALLVGVPLVIIGVAVAPLLLVGLPILLLVMLVFGLVLVPIAATIKALFC